MKFQSSTPCKVQSHLVLYIQGHCSHFNFSGCCCTCSSSLPYTTSKLILIIEYLQYNHHAICSLKLCWCFNRIGMTMYTHFFSISWLKPHKQALPTPRILPQRVTNRKRIENFGIVKGQQKKNSESFKNGTCMNCPIWTPGTSFLYHKSYGGIAHPQLAYRNYRGCGSG